MARLEINDFQALNYKTLDDKKTLIIVVDMVKGFCEDGAMADSAISSIASDIQNLLRKFSNHLYFKEWHELGCKEFSSFPCHCLKDTKESELLDCFQEDAKNHPVIHKNSTNGFMAPDFINHLDQYVMPYEHFVVTGCCTDICVMQFCLSLMGYLSQHDLNKEIIVPLNSVDSYHIEGIHDVKQFNDIAIRIMANAGIKIVSKID